MQPKNNKLKPEKEIRIPLPLTQKLDKISLVEFQTIDHLHR